MGEGGVLDMIGPTATGDQAYHEATAGGGPPSGDGGRSGHPRRSVRFVDS